MQLKISYFHLQTGHYKYKTFYVGSWKPQRKHIVNTQKTKEKGINAYCKGNYKGNTRSSGREIFLLFLALKKKNPSKGTSLG